MPFANGNVNMAKTYDEDGTETGSITERQQKKKRNIDTPDNFNYGDMPADFRKRYKQMLEGK